MAEEIADLIAVCRLSFTAAIPSRVRIARTARLAMRWESDWRCPASVAVLAFGANHQGAHEKTRRAIAYAVAQSARRMHRRAVYRVAAPVLACNIGKTLGSF